MPSLHIVVVEVAASKDTHEFIELWANLTDEAIKAFAEQNFDKMHSSPILKAHFKSVAAMLSEVVARLAREWQILTPRVLLLWMIWGCLLFFVLVVLLFVLHLDKFGWTQLLNLSWFGIDGFRFGIMSVYHFDLVRGHKMGHWTLNHISFWIVQIQMPQNMIYWLANKSSILLRLVWIIELRHGFYHDGLQEMEKNWWFKFTLTHWLCPW